MTNILSQESILKKEFLSLKDKRSGNILSVIFPSGIEIGTGIRGFNKGIKFKSIDVQPTDSKNLLYQQNDELYYNGSKLASGTAQSSGGAPTDAQYLTLASNSTLTNERILTAGSNITFITTPTTLTITCSVDPAQQSAPINATYIVASSNSTLTNEKILTASSGILIFDSGSIFELSTKPYGSNKEIQFNLNGSLTASSNLTFDNSLSLFSTPNISSQKLTGSLTKLNSGDSYLVAGNNVTISSQSNGSILISSTGGSGGSTFVEWDPDAPPLSANIVNDEFLTGSLSGWTTWDPGSSGMTAQVTKGFLQIKQPVIVGDILAGIYRWAPTGSSPSYEYSIVSKLSMSSQDATNFPGVTIFVATDLQTSPSTSKLYLVNLINESSQFRATSQEFNQYNSYSVSYGLREHNSTSIYGRIRVSYNSTSSQTALGFDYSSDGMSWQELGSTVKSAQYKHIGLAVNNTGGSAPFCGYYKFFRAYLTSSFLFEPSGSFITKTYA